MNLSTLLVSNASSEGMSSDTLFSISLLSGVVIFAMNSNFAFFIDVYFLITVLYNGRGGHIFYRVGIFNRTGRIKSSYPHTSTQNAGNIQSCLIGGKTYSLNSYAQTSAQPPTRMHPYRRLSSCFSSANADDAVPLMVLRQDGRSGQRNAGPNRSMRCRHC